MLNSLLHYFLAQPSPGYRPKDPSILCMGYYPIRIVLAEWNLYIHLTSRYSKHYEFSVQDIHSRVHDNDLVDLQRLQDYADSLERMVAVATSMVQLLASRRSILEAVNVRRLTYIALVFVPLGWVASLFSMSDTYLPGHEHFWVYFATAFPLLALVLLLPVLPYEAIGEIAKKVWKERAKGRGSESRLKYKVAII